MKAPKHHKVTVEVYAPYDWSEAEVKLRVEGAIQTANTAASMGVVNNADCIERDWLIEKIRELSGCYGRHNVVSRAEVYRLLGDGRP